LYSIFSFASPEFKLSPEKTFYYDPTEDSLEDRKFIYHVFDDKNTPKEWYPLNKVWDNYYVFEYRDRVSHKKYANRVENRINQLKDYKISFVCHWFKNMEEIHWYRERIAM